MTAVAQTTRSRLTRCRINRDLAPTTLSGTAAIGIASRQPIPSASHCEFLLNAHDARVYQARSATFSEGGHKMSDPWRFITVEKLNVGVSPDYDGVLMILNVGRPTKENYSDCTVGNPGKRGFAEICEIVQSKCGQKASSTPPRRKQFD